jgi:L-ascorbate metabolism protein UlaG (beta-lactamase superfamily)
MYNQSDNIGGCMEITWFGLSCFRLAERGFATVVTDPFDSRETGYGPAKLKANIVTISHDIAGFNHLETVEGEPYIIKGPGEYEVGGVFITGIQLGGQNRPEEPGSNTVFVFDYDSLTVAHLGDLNHAPSQAEIEAMGTVNVVLVPIGSSHGLNPARAAEVISLLEPNLVIPMHYASSDNPLSLDSLSKFLKEMGITEVETQSSLKISGSSLPEETRVVVLDYQSN